MNRYGKPIYNEDESLNKISWLDSGKVLIHPTRGRIHNPSESDFIECGYLPEVIPDISRFEYVDILRDICPFGATEINHPVVKQDVIKAREALKANIELVSDSKVEIVAPSRKVGRFNAKANKLNRKAIKHLKDPVNNPDLSPEEEQLAEQLEALEGITEAIREAEDLIIEELSEMADNDIYNLPEGWEENHQNWP